jgi:hypothetical protein
MDSELDGPAYGSPIYLSICFLFNFIYDSCSAIMSTCVCAPYSTLFLIISGCVLWRMVIIKDISI